MGERLHDLRISNSSITNNFVDDETLFQIAAKCPNLRRLTILSCPYYYMYGKQHDGLTDAGVFSILTRCKHLEKLDLAHTAHVTIAPFAAVAKMLDKPGCKLCSANATHRGSWRHHTHEDVPAWDIWGDETQELRDRLEEILSNFTFGRGALDGFRQLEDRFGLVTLY
jgi:hypothetical protein